MGQKFGTQLTACNVLVLGLDNSGKSSIINWMKTKKATTRRQHRRTRRAEEMSMMTPTIGFRLERIRVQSIALTLVDMSGQGRYRNLWEYYYKECDGIVFVVDSSDRKRLPVAFEEKDLMLLHPIIVNKVIPILYFANKMDRDGALSCEELRQLLSAQGHFGKKPWKVVCSNALTGVGVTAGFEWLVEQISITHLAK